MENLHTTTTDERSVFDYIIPFVIGIIGFFIGGVLIAVSSEPGTFSIPMQNWLSVIWGVIWLILIPARWIIEEVNERREKSGRDIMRTNALDALLIILIVIGLLLAIVGGLSGTGNSSYSFPPPTVPPRPF